MALLDASGPLEGIRVVDLTSVVMGPYATQILSDMGADVVSVEPVSGGGNRVMGPGPHRQFSGISLNLLRNKRNLSIDIRNPDGLKVLEKLVGTVDVVITNFRRKALVRLGLNLGALSEVNPRLVVCHANGFPDGSELADAPAYDDVIQAMSGLANAQQLAHGGEPMLAPTILADKVSGLYIVAAVLGALVQRTRTGRGQLIEVPMSEAMLAFTLVEHGAGAIAEPPIGSAGYKRVLNPERGPQQTADGWIQILPYSQANYDHLFRVGGRSDLIESELTAGNAIIENAPYLYAAIRPIIRRKATSFWIDFCGRHDIPVGDVATLDDLVSGLPLEVHPHAGPYRVTPSVMRYSEAEVGLRRYAARIGEDSLEILQELGYSPADVANLVGSGIVRTSERRKPNGDKNDPDVACEVSTR